MKIYDCFTFFNEIETLEIRLKLLGDVCDYFVISEANVTHAGVPKPYLIKKHYEKFSAYKDKLILLEYEPDLSSYVFDKGQDCFDSNSAPWRIERGQRDYLWSFLKHAHDKDIAVISDADEICDPRLLSVMKLGKLPFLSGLLELQFHYYYLNCRGVGPVNRVFPRAYYSSIEKLRHVNSLSKIREEASLPSVRNAGWHFSYLGGALKVRQKIEAFAHQELNKEHLKDLVHLQECIDNGLDYLSRDGHEWAFYPVSSYPDFLAKVMLEHRNLLKISLI